MSLSLPNVLGSLRLYVDDHNEMLRKVDAKANIMYNLVTMLGKVIG